MLEKAAGNGGPDTKSGRSRLLARLGLGADVSHEAAAVWVVSALALAVITVLAVPGEEVDAAPATVSGAIGASGADGVGNGPRDCLRRYRRQPAPSSEICTGLDEMVGAPDPWAGDGGVDKTNATVAAVNPANSALDTASAAQMRIECLRRYRWQPWLRDQFCAWSDEMVGQPSASAGETDGGEAPGKANR